MGKFYEAIEKTQKNRKEFISGKENERDLSNICNNNIRRSYDINSMEIKEIIYV